jgi:hypothetical protein
MFSVPPSGAPALLLASFVLVTASCDVRSMPNSQSTPEREQLGDYGAQMRVLFDDELGGVNLAGSLLPPTPESNKLLSRRILEANVVVACQIQTITEGSAGNTTYAKIEFRGAGQQLSYEGHEECPAISISAQTYSFLLIHHSSSALIGKSIVLFLRKFNEWGREALHWHGEPDGAQIRAEVKRIGSPLH